MQSVMTIQFRPPGFGWLGCADLVDRASVSAEKLDPEAKEDVYYKCPSDVCPLLSLEISKLRGEVCPFHSLRVSHTQNWLPPLLKRENRGLVTCLNLIVLLYFTRICKNNPV